jgi:hypothetical protein
VKGGLRLADLLAGLSLITDYEPDDAVRSCLVATALAPPEARREPGPPVGVAPADA